MANKTKALTFFWIDGHEIKHLPHMIDLSDVEGHELPFMKPLRGVIPFIPGSDLHVVAVVGGKSMHVYAPTHTDPGEVNGICMSLDAACDAAFESAADFICKERWGKTARQLLEEEDERQEAEWEASA